MNSAWRCNGWPLLAALSLAGPPTRRTIPKRPITMIVPFAAGGTSDVIARVVAEEMAKSLGQPIVIENVAGAGGSTALTRAARAEPDGYTIAIGNAGTSAATYTIYPKLPFTPEFLRADRGRREDLRHRRAAQGFSGQEPAGIHRLREEAIPARSISAMPASARRIS